MSLLKRIKEPSTEAEKLSMYMQAKRLDSYGLMHVLEAIKEKKDNQLEIRSYVWRNHARFMSQSECSNTCKFLVYLDIVDERKVATSKFYSMAENWDKYENMINKINESQLIER